MVQRGKLVVGDRSPSLYFYSEADAGAAQPRDVRSASFTLVQRRGAELGDALVGLGEKGLAANLAEKRLNVSAAKVEDCF